MNLENEQESIEAERLMMRILQVSFDSSCPRVGVIALIAALASFPTGPNGAGINPQKLYEAYFDLVDSMKN